MDFHSLNHCTTVALDSDDDLVTYGTPLEPLEEDEIPSKKPRLLEDQVVTDKQGRRRFHGAFTGGFSAGFFNTVGSLEGWTPTSFKSSRSKKQELSHRKPEDFMDEEDLSEFGIAPLVLKAKKDYTDEIIKKISAFADAPTLGTYVLKDLLKPVRETVGIKLLKKMGWKPGQGVGPRLNKHMKEATHKIRQKNYGCQLPPRIKEDKDSDSDSDWEDIEFAPNDYEPILSNARDNFFGIGYEGLDKRPILSSGPDFNPNHQDKSKKVGFGSQAFGVGAFEEEDDDIYAKDDMSRYDFALGNDNTTNEPTVKATAEGVLEGFVLATKQPRQKHYPLPVLPREFKARHKIRKTRFDQLPAEKESLIMKPKLNHTERGKLIEQEVEEEKQKQRKEELVKELIANVNINESKFKPFATNPEKQERYEYYLKLVELGKQDRLVDLQPALMNSWDKQREKAEFQKAAELFKPLSGGMEDRFATASQPDDLSDPLAVVEKFCDENDDRRKAAKMKMFGPLTRKTEDWIPCQLLCKRFNIPEPRKEDLPKTEKKQRKSNFSRFDNFDVQKQNVYEVRTEKLVTEKEPESASLSQPEAKEINLENIQNKTDLFKAIFLASDEEEEQTKEEKLEVEYKGMVSEKSYEDEIINSKRNLSPPRGIFETLDLDLLSKRRPPAKPEKSIAEVDPSPKSKEIESVQDLVYGPKIPEKVVKTSQTFEQESDDELWVEKKAKDKKHKKKDKKLKKSHKSKHKYKKHKR